MKLYTYPPAPNPRRLDVFLAEKGLSIPSEPVDLMKGEQLSEAYRAVNPLCTVPALVTDEGVTLAQVSAICDYLEALHPEPALLGRTPIEKGQVREWCHRVFMEGLSAIADAFRNGNPAFAHRALPGPLDLEQLPALVDRGLLRLEAFWRTLDAHLAGREFMVGDSLTMADIDAVIACDFARWIRKSIPEECTNIRRWHAALSARPSFKAPAR
jgi:glutathione S-transferase